MLQAHQNYTLCNMRKILWVGEKVSLGGGGGEQLHLEEGWLGGRGGRWSPSVPPSLPPSLFS